MYKENNSLFWYYILSVLSGAAITFFTWRIVHYQKKQMKETLPKITDILQTLSKEPGHFIAIVVNRKSQRITYDEIYYKQKFTILPFFKKRNIAEQPAVGPKKSYSNSDNKIFASSNIQITYPDRYIDSQKELLFIIPNFDPKATYKILVETSVGNCSKLLSNIQDDVEN